MIALIVSGYNVVTNAFQLRLAPDLPSATIFVIREVGIDWLRLAPDLPSATILQTPLPVTPSCG